MTNQTTKLIVHCDGYDYEIELGDELSLTYLEPTRPDATAVIAFGSLQEMESVAKAMLKAAKIHEE